MRVIYCPFIFIKISCYPLAADMDVFIIFIFHPPIKHGRAYQQIIFPFIIQQNIIQPHFSLFNGIPIFAETAADDFSPDFRRYPVCNCPLNNFPFIEQCIRICRNFIVCTKLCIIFGTVRQRKHALFMNLAMVRFMGFICHF